MTMACRGCGYPVSRTLVDLGVQPLSNSYVSRDRTGDPEAFFPLVPLVCEQCFFVQLGVFESPENIFTDYAYFSSFSTSWLEHCSAHVADSIDRLHLDASSFVVEVASNDGYLLQSFVERGIRVLGIEPAKNVALAAIERGVPTETTFFGAESARAIRAQHGAANMMLANNVLAHVPDIHDFIEGIRILLADDGVATIEFPHLVPLLEENQFDTIYHEHFSYLSLLALEPVFARHDLVVSDVDRLPTHGGSLRVWVRHRAASPNERAQVAIVRELEKHAGLDRLETYDRFAQRAFKAKYDLLRFLMDARDAGKTTVAYGAAAKGNTLLNFCGIRSDLIAFVVDRNPHKVGTLLPGSRLPVRAVADLERARPDYVLILPWNLRSEIVQQMSNVASWGGKFVVAIPELHVLS